MNARDLWRVLEPFHQLAYRTAEAVERMTAIGVDRPELQYFGSRLAALGPVPHHVAVAVLYGFAPDYVARAVPEVWARATPAAIVAARVAAVDATSRRVFGAEIDSPRVAAAATLARRAAENCDLAARPLGAAHLSLDWPDAPLLQLWHACTVLREHRGDAHWAVTSALELDAVECHVLHGADGHMPLDVLQRVTGWDDAAWAEATERLLRRGLLRDATRASDEGARLKADLERRTDRLSARPFRALQDDEQLALRDSMAPLVTRLLDSGVAAVWKVREELWRELPE